MLASQAREVQDRPPRLWQVTRERHRTSDKGNPGVIWGPQSSRAGICPVGWTAEEGCTAVKPSSLFGDCLGRGRERYRER